MPSPLEGLRLGLWAFGCRTNQYEGEALCSSFVEAGATVEDEGPWDVALVVSCAVTGEAERKCRQLLRRIRRESPQALVVLCGCLGQMADAEEARRLEVDVLVGNGLKHRLREAVEGALAGTLPLPAVLREDVWQERSWDGLVLHRLQRHTRAFLKIQEGCDHFCTYCIVPVLRGKPLSRPVEDVLREAEMLVSSGVREVVLTGVHLGLFGRDTGESLGVLVQRLSALPGLTRIRFGSIEPFALDEPLLQLLAETPKFCPHFHVPLQSGDDGVLARMRRGYSASEFASLVQRIRQYFGDDVHIGSDLLVGFPGEDEAAFERTLRFVRDLGMGRLHIFPYSVRRGTPAATYPKQTSKSVAAERCRRGIALSGELLGRFAARFVGRDLSVLVEKVADGEFEGLSPHYLRVSGIGSAPWGQEREVRILEARHGDLVGEPAADETGREKLS